MKTLGIFVTSDRHPGYLWPLVNAARDKGLRVQIHFCGSGVRLVPWAAVNRLPVSVNITVCLESATLFGLDRQLLSSGSQWLVPSHQSVRLIQECDRRVFF